MYQMEVELRRKIPTLFLKQWSGVHVWLVNNHTEDTIFYKYIIILLSIIINTLWPVSIKK